MNIHEFKLDETASFDWVHVEDLAGVYVLLVRAILEREDHGVGYIPTGKNGIITNFRWAGPADGDDAAVPGRCV